MSEFLGYNEEGLLNNISERNRLLEGVATNRRLEQPAPYLLFHSCRFDRQRDIEEDKYFIEGFNEIYEKIKLFRKENVYKEFRYIGKIKICTKLDEEFKIVKLYLSPEINKEICLRYNGVDSIYIYPLGHKIDVYYDALKEQILKFNILNGEAEVQFLKEISNGFYYITCVIRT